MSHRNSTARLGSFAHARPLRIEPLEERRLLALDAVLVRDITPGEAGTLEFGQFTSVGNQVYFTARDSGGLELWTSDGTDAGTFRVRDIRSGPIGSDPSLLTNVDGTLYFLADDGLSGRELWKSDGTEAGTQRVRDIRPGSVSSQPRFLVNIDGLLYFSATDGVAGYALWRSDGSEAGTIPLHSGDALHITDVDGMIFYFHGSELWKSDGTEAGAVLVKDFSTESYFGTAQQVLAAGGTFFFVDSHFSGEEWYEAVWRSDGTEGGTYPITQSSPGRYKHLTEVDDELYFVDEGGYWHLKKSDGTFDGTVQVAQINDDALLAVYRLLNFRDQLYFVGRGDSFTVLWRSDGSSRGTVLIKHVAPDVLDGNYQHVELSSVDEVLFFVANDAAAGTELWQSDGTEAGTLLVEDIHSGTGGSYPSSLTRAGTTLYFTADDGIHGRELWKVVVEDEATPGDTNGDGAVNIEDLNNVRNYFGATGDGVLGDTSPFDGKVDIQDLNAVRNHFGAGGGAAARGDAAERIAAPIRSATPATAWRHALDAVFGIWANSSSARMSTLRASRQKIW